MVLLIKIFVILLFMLAGLRPLYNTKAHISTAFLHRGHFFQYFPQSKLAPTIKCILPQAARVPQCNTPGSSFRANWRCLEKIPSGGDRQWRGQTGGRRRERKAKRKGDNESLEKKGEKGERLVAD